MGLRLEQVLTPLLQSVGAAMADFDAQVAALGSMPAGNTHRNDLPTVVGALSGVAHASGRPMDPDAPGGLESAPPDLMGFLSAVPVGEACHTLGLSRRTVHRIRHGYWPADSRKIGRAWDAYKGRSVARATSWFIRRVAPDGLRHGGKLYAASQLAGRAGELLAVARAADGGLLAQSLELPAERFTLSVKG